MNECDWRYTEMELAPMSFDLLRGRFGRNESPIAAVEADYAWVDRGMSSSGSVELYRTYAAQCVELALKGPDPETRLALLDIAQAWLALSEHADKNQPCSRIGL